MSVLSELVKKELINLHNNSDNKEDFFNEISDVLQANSYVNSSFREAIITRELKYPTGLALENISIAIPHTDVEYIENPFIFINKMSGQLTFFQMGTNNVEVIPDYIIVLGIKKPKEQVGLLSILMEKFSDNSFLKKLDEASNSKEKMYTLFKSL